MKSLIRSPIGFLSVNGVGTIDLHWWIELSDGRVYDLGAQMWLGTEDGAPHGCLLPSGPQKYEARSVLGAQVLHPGVFAILARVPWTAFLHGPNRNCNVQSDKEALADC